MDDGAAMGVEAGGDAGAIKRQSTWRRVAMPRWLPMGGGGGAARKGRLSFLSAAWYMVRCLLQFAIYLWYN